MGSCAKASTSSPNLSISINWPLKYAKPSLPGFWAELKTGNSAVIPLVHECINGDYFHTGRLNNPRIAIHGDEAQATVLFTKGVCRILLYVTMRREDDRWLITRTEWGES
jgi:hypothetical protein